MKKFTYLDYLKYTRQVNEYSYLSDANEEYQLNRIHQPQDKR